MKRIGNLFERIVSWDNILTAYNNTKKCKGGRTAFQSFNRRKIEYLLNIQESIINGTYEPGDFYEFEVYEPKRRVISALPPKDRIVQHCIYDVLWSYFDKEYIFHSYACRKNKGAQKAMRYLENQLKNIGEGWYAVKFDIKKFFPSMNTDILKNRIRSKIKDKRLIWLLDKFIDHGKKAGTGVPIGNLLSQLFSNFYLNPLDHYIKETLRIKKYVRYMDDFILLVENKEKALDVLDKVTCFIKDHLDMTLNSKTRIIPVDKMPISAFGYVLTKNRTKLRSGTVRKFFYCIRKLIKRKKTNGPYFKSRVLNFVSIANWAKDYALIQKVANKTNSIICIKRLFPHFRHKYYLNPKVIPKGARVFRPQGQ